MTDRGIPPELEAELKLVRSSIPKREPDGRVMLFEFRGRPAASLLGLIALVFVVNAIYRTGEITEPEASAIRRALTLGYGVQATRGVDVTGLTSEELRALGGRLESYDRVTIRSVSAKGWLDKKMIRVTVSVAGGAPPDGLNTRYFHVDCRRGCRAVPVPRIYYSLGLWFADIDHGTPSW